MEGKNVYLSVPPESPELLSFCLLKTIDLQAMSDNNAKDHEGIAIDGPVQKDSHHPEQQSLRV